MRDRTEQAVDPYREAIERALRALATRTHSAHRLHEPLRYALSRPAKRIRPLLVFLSYSLFRDDWSSVTPAALAVELLHNFTLIHDDIIDKSPLRRGQPTIHEKWSLPVAVLAGDLMLVQAYEHLSRCAADKLPLLLSLFNRCARALCEGQQLDVAFEKMPIQSVSERDYTRMIALKTGSLLSLSLRMGGVLAGVDRRTEEVLEAVGEKMGIIFQLKDDLLDIYGDQLRLGKEKGRDIVSNKKTYVLIKTMQRASAAQRMRIAAWHEAKDGKEAKIEAITGLMEALNVKTLAEAAIRTRQARCVDLIKALDGVREEARTTFLAFAEHLTARKH